MDAITKPDRMPDHITTYGSMFYWHEMIYVGATGQTAKIIIGEDGQLWITGLYSTPHTKLNPRIKDAYNYWLYGAMEDAILTASEEQDGGS